MARLVFVCQFLNGLCPPLVGFFFLQAAINCGVIPAEKFAKICSMNRKILYLKCI